MKPVEIYETHTIVVIAVPPDAELSTEELARQAYWEIVRRRNLKLFRKWRRGTWPALVILGFSLGVLWMILNPLLRQ